MIKLQPTPLWLHDVPQHPSVLVSPETRQLAHLFTAGIAVPTSFVVPGDVFLFFLKHAELKDKITEIVANTDSNNNQQLAQASQKIQHLIAHTSLPAKMTKMLDKAFDLFVQHVGKTSSCYNIRPQFATPTTGHIHELPATTVTTAQAFRAFLVATYCSLFDPTLLHSWLAHGCDFEDIALSFLVQPQFDSQASGTALFENDSITIRAIYGSVAPLLTNAIKPDLYEIDAKTFEILNHDINRQTWRLDTKHVTVPRIDQSLAKLKQQEITAAAQLALVAEKYTGIREIIWQLDTAGRMWITSLRKVTALSSKETTGLLATGKPISAGIASGTVRLIHTKADIAKLSPKDIAVIELADFRTQSFPKVAGIIAESGTTNAALSRLAKQQAIPMVIGTGTALHQLRNSLLVTLNGFTGEVFRGINDKNIEGSCHHCNTSPNSAVTGTKIYAALEDLSEDVMADGVLISSDQLYHQIETGSAKHSTEALTASLAQVHGDASKPLIYQVSDNDTTPFGYRGAIKHLHNPEQLKIELEALRRFEATHHAHAVLILPSMRTHQEFMSIQHLLNGSGLDLGNRTKLWLPCHVPATLFMLDQFLTDELISGVYVELEELAQHTLGADMSHKQLMNEYDLHDNAVFVALEHIAQHCREQNMPLIVRINDETSPELTEALIALGVTSLIVPADEVIATRSLIASTEQRIILDHAIAELHAEPVNDHHHS